MNWLRLAQAKEYYEEKGYKYVDLPWIVHSKAVDVTIPKDKKRFDVMLNSEHPQHGSWTTKPIGSLIGSGEQAFIQNIDALDDSGQYQTITPCFRDDEEDELHQRQFMKLELFRLLGQEESANECLFKMAWDARFYFAQTTSNDLIETQDGFDIEVNGIEVGSYGIRSFEGHRWIYGTGLAEPRFSIALKKGKI